MSLAEQRTSSDPVTPAGRPAWARVLSRVYYPVQLAAIVGLAWAAIALDWDFGVVSGSFLVGILGSLLLLERLIPYDRDWQPNPQEWRFYGVYFVLTVAASSASQIPVMAVFGYFTPPEPFLPLGVEIVLAGLVGSLANYAWHRWSHTNLVLWRLHGVHHVPDKVNVANNGVNHVFDVLLTQFSVQFVLTLCGFSEPSVFAVGLFVMAQGYFVHANVDVKLGRINYVFSGPEQHRLHHSTNLKQAGHFGSDLSIWDLLFRSFTWRPGLAPQAVGLSNPKSFPTSDRIVSSMVHPLSRSWHV
ncbi:sterol desaturase family protein [Actinoplanes rectilineatus]|uniref:sterol desaturase family protein n=1 Tax=Actinoplanes rectilineatus TaxID=113571 RepID=UPI0009F9AE53|nr:sterol desaturase family protein [Actinoplanes rectilineatus]